MQDIYIIEMLAVNQRVILPQIGAFIKKTEDNLEVTTFNSILKFDDGKIIEFIIEKEGVDKDAAKIKLNKYVDAILKKIDNGDQYKIASFGNLYKDATGKVQFLETPNAEKKSTDKATQPIAPKTETVIIKETPKAEEIKIAPEAIPAKPIEKARPIYEETIKLNTDTTNPNKTSQMKKPSTAQKSVKTKKSSSKSTSFWIVGVVLIIALGIGLFLVFSEQTDESESITVKKTELKNIEQEVEAEINSDPAIEDTVSKIAQQLKDEAQQEAANQSITKENKTPKTEPTATGKPKFYIVAGCFQSEENANKLATQLKKEGFASAYKFGTIRDGLHAVCYEAYTTRDKANIGLTNLKEKNKKGWILEY